MENNKIKKKFAIIRKCYIIAIILYVVTIGTSSVAFAASDDPLAVINNLSDFIFSILRAVGILLAGLGVVQIGLAFKTHDPSQRAQGILACVGGIIIAFAKTIITVITS